MKTIALKLWSITIIALIYITTASASNDFEYKWNSFSYNVETGAPYHIKEWSGPPKLTADALIRLNDELSDCSTMALSRSNALGPKSIRSEVPNWRTNDILIISSSKENLDSIFGPIEACHYSYIEYGTGAYKPWEGWFSGGDVYVAKNIGLVKATFVRNYAYYLGGGIDSSHLSINENPKPHFTLEAVKVEP